LGNCWSHPLEDAINRAVGRTRIRIAVVGIGHDNDRDLLFRAEINRGLVAGDPAAVTDQVALVAVKDREAQAPAALPVGLQPVDPVHFLQRAALENLTAAGRSLAKL